MNSKTALIHTSYQQEQTNSPNVSLSNNKGTDQYEFYGGPAHEAHI
jgi:hypothetical protein